MSIDPTMQDDGLYDIADLFSQDDRRMLDLLLHPVAFVDRSGAIQELNDAFRDAMDLRGAGRPTATLASILTAEDWTSCRDFLRRGAEDHAHPFEATVRLRGKTMSLSLSALQTRGPVIGYLCQLQEVGRYEDPRLAYLMDHLDQGVWDYDVATRTLTVSKMWREIRGIGPDVDINAPGRRWKDNTHTVDRVTPQDAFDEQVRGERASINIQYRYRHMAGHWIWVLCRARVVEKDAEGKPLRIIGTDTDVTVLRRRDTVMKQLTDKLQLAIDASGIGVWEFDYATSEVHWDDRMLEIYGITDGQNVRAAEMWAKFLHPDDVDAAQAYSDHCQKHGLDFRRDFRIVRPDGEIRYIRSLAGHVSASASHTKLIGVNIDVTDDYEQRAELEAARSQLEYDSRHDALTGLANRRLLDERFQALSAQATPNARCAVLHLDLDYFKQINDTLGHAAGDAVLIHVANMLSDLVADRGLVCRTGGDEFVALFDRAPSKSEMQEICAAIIVAFDKPFYHEDRRCAFGVSIGCAFCDGIELSETAVFVRADAALYSAKQAGRGCYRFYTDQTTSQVQPEDQMRRCLLDALTNCEIICHYQPQFDSQSQALVGAEALVRWQCPERGLMAPDAFMLAAVRLGLANRIDGYVFEQVIALQSSWFAKGVSFPIIAMNVSLDRFSNPTMLDHVRNLIRPHHRISFELLETAFLDDLDADQLAKLNDLRSLGILIDLDDFGSGHSSVAAMQAVKPDRIKVDQSLVGPIAARPEQIKTLQLLSQLGRLEGLQIVIEGLDTQAHLDAIAQVDCDVLQGFAMARPLPVAEFEALLHQPS
ncbi:MAG: EAL domain-containing protein [Pseudomonadota bacterium]